MPELFLLPNPVLLALSMLAALAMLAQCVAFLSALRPGRERLVRAALELVTLGMTLAAALQVAMVLYHAWDGFVYPVGGLLTRRLLCGALCALAADSCLRQKNLWPLTSLAALPLVWPGAGVWLGRSYPAVFFAALTFLLLRGMSLCAFCRRERRRRITAASVKEAIDALHTGLLFCEPDGFIVLCNRRMERLMLALTGTVQRNGTLFFERLAAGETLPGCERCALGEAMAYRLPDGRVWAFERCNVTAGRRYVLLTASDQSERWNAAQELLRQNEALAARNAELTETLDNLRAVCEAEEALRARARVHAVLGQRVSLLLRALRESREPDERLLAPFANGMPRELLTEAAQTPADRLETLREVFRGLGVTVELSGALPDGEPEAACFAAIVQECVTNAVRHACATRVDIRIRRDGGWRLEAENNGVPPEGALREGGGIREMRRRAEECGGSLSVSTAPRFCVTAILPEVDE